MNPLYLHITHANRYIEEGEVNKYIIFDPIKLHFITSHLMELRSVDKNKDLLKKIQ